MVTRSVQTTTHRRYLTRNNKLATNSNQGNQLKTTTLISTHDDAKAGCQCHSSLQKPGPHSSTTDQSGLNVKEFNFLFPACAPCNLPNTNNLSRPFRSHLTKSAIISHHSLNASVSTSSCERQGDIDAEGIRRRQL